MGFAPAPDWATALLEELGEHHSEPRTSNCYLAYLNGCELSLSEGQYEHLATRIDRLPPGPTIVIDKPSGVAFVNRNGIWGEVRFRVGPGIADMRSGPFALLCICARQAGTRFSNSQLRARMARELGARASWNVADMVSQLRKRIPALSILKDSDGTYISESERVVLLDLRR